MAPFWITQERGFFRNNGLDVQLVFIESGCTTVQSLISQRSSFRPDGGNGRPPKPTNIRILGALAMAFIMGSACNHSEPKMPAYSGQTTLTSVVNTVVIEGVPEAVFDLVTMAHFWPQWHPATTAVTGVTQRPYLLGDRIIEQGRIGKGEFTVTWQVAEHIRPHRVTLQSESSPVQIIYSFSSRGNATEYTRELRYDVDDLKSIAADPNEVNRLMRAQSEQAVKQLKALVEKILRDERN
jgi:uncharacterized protein YndB with AHSA1/START domain